MPVPPQQRTALHGARTCLRAAASARRAARRGYGAAAALHPGGTISSRALTVCRLVRIRRRREGPRPERRPGHPGLGLADRMTPAWLSHQRGWRVDRSQLAALRRVHVKAPLAECHRAPQLDQIRHPVDVFLVEAEELALPDARVEQRRHGGIRTEKHVTIVEASPYTGTSRTIRQPATRSANERTTRAARSMEDSASRCLLGRRAMA